MRIKHSVLLVAVGKYIFGSTLESVLTDVTSTAVGEHSPRGIDCELMKDSTQVDTVPQTSGKARNNEGGSSIQCAAKLDSTSRRNSGSGLKVEIHCNIRICD